MSAYLRPTARVAGATVLGAGLAYTGYRYWNTTHFYFNTAHAESLPSDSTAALKKMDWKGFTELKLVQAEMVNHNVKRLTFALPDDQSITGLSPISKFSCFTGVLKIKLADPILASLLTRHTPEGAFIPVFRPYTPVSDNGKCQSCSRSTTQLTGFRKTWRELSPSW